MDDRQLRSRSFGTVADQYEAFRPGPPGAAVDWILERPATTVIDLGAGTGALTRLLVPRVPTVIAVEPDPEMRRLLEAGLADQPNLEVRPGTGEELPVDAVSVDAVIASSSWHWVDPSRGLAEAARVLTPGGTLAALWTGPDPDGAFMRQAQAALGHSGGNPELAATVAGERNPASTSLDVPEGGAFDPPERQQFHVVLDLTADQLIGLLATLSWIIVLDEAARLEIFEAARRLLRDALGIEGPVTAAVEFLCDAYRTSLAG